MQPIYQPLTATLTMDGHFRVLVDGVPVFSGYAAANPADGSRKVTVNDIVAPFLYTALPTSVGSQADARLSVAVKVVENTAYPNGGWTIDALAEDVVYDWSYGRAVPFGTLNCPMSEHPEGAPLFAAFRGAGLQPTPGGYDIAYFRTLEVRADGTAPMITNTDCTALSPRYNIVINRNATPSDPSVGLRLDYIDANIDSYSKGVRLAKCQAYALCYANAFGGWDWLCLKGAVKRRDAVTRREFTTLAGERRNYLNEMQPSWECHTGLLNDADLAQMWQVLESRQVYFYEILSGTYTPVLVTNAECDYRTNRTNPGNGADYVLTLEQATQEVRR